MSLDYAISLLGDFLKTKKVDTWGMLSLRDNGDFTGWIYANKGNDELFGHIVFSNNKNERVSSKQMQDILYDTQEILFDTIKQELVPCCMNIDRS